MRKLEKAETPPLLRDNASKWTEVYLEALKTTKGATSTQEGRYKLSEIKNVLQGETLGKCAYCESKILANYPGDVEHIYPKTHYPKKIFNWDNLTLSCWQCNNSKRDYINDPALLNPYVDDPSEHICFIGGLLQARTEKGRITEMKIDLNRVGLTGKRDERLKSLHPLIAQYRNTKDAATRQLLKEELEKEAAPDKEFSFAVECYLLSSGL